MSQNPHVDFTHSKFIQFKQAFTRALEQKQAEFEFDNNEFLTEYARYVVEYLDNKFEHITSSEKETD